MNRQYGGRAVILAITLLLSGCFLFPSEPISDYAKQMLQNGPYPHLTGQWTFDGVKYDIRQGPDDGQWRKVELAVAADSPAQPNWTFNFAIIEPPDSPGYAWQVLLVVDRKPETIVVRPGQTVSNRVQTYGWIAADCNSINFEGMVWTRSGDVGALQPPPPGQLKFGIHLAGGAVSTFSVPPSVSEPSAECLKRCREKVGCVAMTVVNRECSLKTSVGTPETNLNAASWINPEVKQAELPPPNVGAPGVLTAGVDLSGQDMIQSTADRSTLEGCQNHCIAYRQCVAFVYIAGACHMKTAIGSPSRLTAATSWVKPANLVPPEPVVDPNLKPGICIGGDLIVDQLIRADGSIKGCSQLCREQGSMCLGVSWYEPARSCKTYRRIGQNESTGPGCAGWIKPAAEVAAERAAEEACQANRTHPKGVVTPADACRGHGAVWTAFRIQHIQSFYDKGSYNGEAGWPGDFLDVTNGNLGLAAKGVSRTYWHIMPMEAPLPTSSTAKNTIKVHIHNADNPALVLKRSGDQVVVGPVDDNAEWSLEYSWEYNDYLVPGEGRPAINGTGRLVVIRSADTSHGHWFLTKGESGIALTSDPGDISAHWRVSSYRIGECDPEEPQDLGPLVADAPAPLMDEAMVDSLADWVVDEYTNSLADACWKRDGVGPCDSSRPVDCGLGCSRSRSMCVTDALSKAVSVGQMVSNVASIVGTLGISAAVSTVIRTAAKQGSKMALKVAIREGVRIARTLVKEVVKRFKKNLKKYVRTKLQEMALAGKTILTEEGNVALNDAMAGRQEERIAEEVLNRAAERIYLASQPDLKKELLDAAETIDPTGVIGAVRAFIQPHCGDVPMP